MPHLSIADASLIEGDSGASSMVFTVTRSGEWTTAVGVNYTTVDGTAKAGTDYTATSGTLSFAANQTTASIAVPVIGDTVYQSNHVFSVQLSTAPQFSVAASSGVGGPVHVLSTADINSDGLLDIVSTYNYGGLGILLGQGDGTFRRLSCYLGYDPKDAVVADSNGDGSGRLLRTMVGSETVGSNDILVKCTLNGDSDLSGTINADDYFHIDAGIMRAQTGYRNGDLDYNNKVDADDYFLIDSAFLGQTASQNLGTKTAPMRTATAKVSTATSAATQSSRKSATRTLPAHKKAVPGKDGFMGLMKNILRGCARRTPSHGEGMDF